MGMVWSLGVCDHINHFGCHIKEIWILKAWGAAMLKGPGENTGDDENLLIHHSDQERIM